jgi:hypothetical protein
VYVCVCVCLARERVDILEGVFERESVCKSVKVGCVCVCVCVRACVLKR